MQAMATQPETRDHERELCVRAKDGDRGALTDLVALYWNQLKQWAMWEVGDMTLADDACQEAWIRITGAVGRLDPERPIAGYLRTIVRNCCRDLASREQRAVRPVPVLVRQADPVDRTVDVRRGAERMLRAFENLSPRQREALDLVDREGLSAPEAAARMGAKPATVRVLVHQGRRALRQDLLADGLIELVRNP